MIDPAAGAPAEWPVSDANEELEATPPGDLVSLVLPDEGERFFVVEGFPVPPEVVFGDDFESGPGDWRPGPEGRPGTRDFTEA